jgi:intraflagellar transport protein 52
MRGAAAAKSAFNDPTKGGAVPQGREAAPSVVFSQCKDEKFHPSSRPSGYKQWFRRLRSSFRPSSLKDEISDKTLVGVDILVLGAPQTKFSVDEFDALKDFIHAGGAVLVLADEGGEQNLGTNVNYLLEEYGIFVNADVAVRALPFESEYVHPKETLVTDGVLNRAVQRFVDKARARNVAAGRENEAPNDKNAKGSLENDSAFEPNASSSSSSSSHVLGKSAPVRFVVPFCATLNVQKPAVPVLSTGATAVPPSRPLAALWAGNPSKGEGRGKVCVLGSGRMADDEWLDKEDNAKVLDFFLRWLSPGSDLSLYALDAEEPDVSEYDSLPDVAALAERPKACLVDGSGTADLPKDFTKLFIDHMYAMDMDLVPEAVDLYAALGVEKAPLDLIAPQFEAPTPATKPAVFPPALRELPPPPLELFDLEEAFANDTTKLAALFHRCARGTDEDLSAFVNEGARICGVSARTRGAKRSRRGRGVGGGVPRACAVQDAGRLRGVTDASARSARE